MTETEFNQAAKEGLPVTVCHPQDSLTGQEWLDRTLRAVAGHVTNGGKDYIQSNKDFRARTITIGELEKVLQKVAGIE